MYCLFDDSSYFEFLPLTYTRPLYALRCGILTFAERWEKVLAQPIDTLSYDYLASLWTHVHSPAASHWLNGRIVPNDDLLRLIASAEPDTFYVNDRDEVLIAHCANRKPATQTGIFDAHDFEEAGLRKVRLTLAPLTVRTLPDLFLLNAQLIQYDYALLTYGRRSAPITDPHTRVYGADNIFVEEGVDIKAATLNAENGVMYFGYGSTIQEGAILHGTHALCDHATVNMGAKMRGDTTVGPFSKVGGEVANSVIMGYSNKGHDGYLGNSIIGYWCNLGADTNTSNLKNNYANVKLWNYAQEKQVDTGLQFCGLIMGDHSKCGINTMFNTGTVVGVGANIYGGGFPATHLPSFAWGGAEGLMTHRFEKMLETAHTVTARRKIVISEAEITILQAIYRLSAPYRAAFSNQQ